MQKVARALSSPKKLAWLGAFLVAHGSALAAGAFGLCYFLAIGSVRTLDPTWAQWLMTEDGVAHLSGWLFFRNEDWRFPLGALPNLLYPLGTTVALTDSIPSLAVAFKLVSPILPLWFHYFGLFLASCFFLQGFVGAKLISLSSRRPEHQLLGGALFCVSPTLFGRIPHEALCAHWGILLVIYMSVVATRSSRVAYRCLSGALGLNLLFAGIHPYLEAMILALSLALCLRIAMTRVLSLKTVAGFFVAMPALVLLEIRCFGYIGGDAQLQGGEFGVFSADLGTFINPVESSRFFSELPMGRGQYEGSAYLGAGVLFLAVLGLEGVVTSLGAIARKRPWRHWPLFTICWCLAFFALASPITLFGRELVELELYGGWMRSAALFRSSGRFIWPLHYLVIVLAFALVLQRWRPRRWLATICLAIALALQIGELRPRRASQYLRRAWDHPAAVWKMVGPPYKHLAMYPPMVKNIAGVPYEEPKVAAMMAVAYEGKLSFNSGYTARFNDRMIDHCRSEVPSAIARGEFDPATVYVTDDPNRAAFARLGALCGRIEDSIVCVVPGRRTELETYLQSHP